MSVNMEKASTSLIIGETENHKELSPHSLKRFQNRLKIISDSRNIEKDDTDMANTHRCYENDMDSINTTKTRITV